VRPERALLLRRQMARVSEASALEGRQTIAGGEPRSGAAPGQEWREVSPGAIEISVAQGSTLGHA